MAVPADVTRRDQVRAAVDTVSRDLGPVDLLVSNAGLRERAPALPWQADPDDWWRVVETNLRGPFLLAHAVLPAMVARGSGRVLHLGSGMAHTPRPEWSAYGTSKAGLGRLTDTLAAALEGTGVVVLEMSPGLVRTDMTETMWGPPDEQVWTPVQAITDGGAAVRPRRAGPAARPVRARGPGRPRRAARGRGQIADRDARTLRLRPYAEDDPLG